MRRGAQSAAATVTRGALVACALVGFTLVGCAGAIPRDAALDARFENARATRGRALAPDLHAAAEDARDDAYAAAEPAARRDHVARAGAWLDAAEAEAERIEIDRARAAIEAELERLAFARAAHERARLTADAETSRADAARLARMRDAAPPEPTGGADRTSRVVHARPEETQVERLRERARLTLAAAVALGLGAADHQVVAESIRAAGAGADRGRVERARRALDAAERALASTRRGAEPAPAREP